MGFIEARIKAEHRKHPKLNWARLAEAKIIMELKDRGLISIENFDKFVSDSFYAL
jgi:hypothetical protein